MMIDELINRKPDEKVVYFLRRHPIIFLADLVIIALLLAIPVGLYAFVQQQWPTLLMQPGARAFVALFGGGYYLVVWFFLLMDFVDYYLDAWIITTDRVLNIEQHSLFSRTISELDLANVQDVTSEVKGFIAFFFGFGNVYIQTAAERERFIFEQVWRPDEVRRNLLAIVETDRQRQGETRPPGT